MVAPFALFPICFVAVFILIIVFAILGSKQRKERMQGLARFAHQMGLRFNPNKDPSFDERYPFFAALNRGSRRFAHNILTGDFEGRSIVGFDYHYETTSRDKDGKTTTTSHYFSAVVFEAGLPINGLAIRPEGVFDRMKRFFGFDDIDFESAEFSRQFHVSCQDRQLAYDVIQPKTMEIMLERQRFYLHFERGLVMAMRNNTFQPDDFRAAMHLVDDILDHIPQSTREQLELKRGR